MDFTSIKQFMDHLTSWRIPGNFISVYHKDREVFTYGSGYNDIDEKTIMTGDELLNIYSCSKVATVVAALQLIEKGQLSLNTPLYDIFPEYKQMYVKQENGDIIKAKEPIRIIHLFTMTAGFDYDLKDAYAKEAANLTNGKPDVVTYTKCLAKKALSFEAGSRWQYSVCHDVLGAVVERVSGMPFSKYVLENVLNPVGIFDAYYHITPDIEKRIASQYMFMQDETQNGDVVAAQIKSPGGEGYIKNVGKRTIDYLDMGDSFDSGGSGIITTVREYAKLASALACKGVAATGERILKEETINLLKTNQLNCEVLRYFDWEQLAGYGYGLGVRTMIDPVLANSNGNVGEFGWCGAAGAMLLVDPESECSFFYAHHMLNPQEPYYLPRLRNAFYSSVK